MVVKKKYSDFWVRVLKTFAQGSLGAFGVLNMVDVSFDRTVVLTVVGGGVSAVAAMLSNLSTDK